MKEKRRICATCKTARGLRVISDATSAKAREGHCDFCHTAQTVFDTHDMTMRPSK